jgi:hypothetical protein
MVEWGVIKKPPVDKIVGEHLDSYLLRKYKITIAEYERIGEAQGWRCGICGEGFGGKRLCVDHDHSTGTVRGLLCNHCNLSLGHLRDSPERCRAAAEYLENPR